MAEKKRSWLFSLPAQMIVGLVLGVIVGAFVSADVGATWFKPLGDLFIRLIRMVVVPLVFATLVAGAASITDISKLGRVAVKILITYMVTTAIAVGFGLGFAELIQPGIGLDLSTSGLAAKVVKAPSIVQTFLNFVPINPMEAMAKGSMLQIIFFAVFFGVCLAGLGERNKPLLEIFQLIGDTMIRVTNAVMYYAPIGVFGLLAYTVSKHGLAVLLPLGKLILASFIATALFCIVVYGAIVVFYLHMPVGRFLKGIFEPWLVAFTTCSSAAALAVNLQACRRLGATKSIASFSIPLGNTINMNGTAIYMGVCAVFAAEIFGMDLTITDQVTIVLMGVMAAIGTAGVPGAGLIMTTVVFTQVGIPLEAVALIAGIDRILDMIRTSINVVGDVASALVVTKSEGDLDSEPYTEG
ncbi:dicarboxylate/amino acid:cation symporter [Mesosutterella sp. OilRF-GAM-744-9]|uniref:Dicarboxylate/amino acid:cation symporter n=1 Tax=Mesosutterella porci TaxID=2915351 RepID=A0ABS9MQH1_9BURK|nr:dicarboxylate/amino acid:cation symporter [Mesosutterella sp. oilRF-744-WT-GAM-9]MCG5030856.1 dicarboxylate/amino acid:cation symporter [Mesosutterella sp. oilRF-744-WT-GAM-9]MCI6529840.1 dicarboxylate/amino acid:cation symporter [Mesosutterella sp.]